MDSTDEVIVVHWKISELEGYDYYMKSTHKISIEEYIKEQNFLYGPNTHWIGNTHELQ